MTYKHAKQNGAKAGGMMGKGAPVRKGAKSDYNQTSIKTMKGSGKDEQGTVLKRR